VTSQASIRTFIAVFPPSAVASAVNAALAKFRAGDDSGVRWVRPENLHYTLRFLGPIAPTRVDAARRAAVRAAAGATPFRVRLGGAGAFPGPRRPRVLWLGAGEGAAPLTLLAGAVERELVAEKFPPGERPFTPHLTVARVAGEAAPAPAVDAFLAAREALPDAAFDVGEIVVVASTLSPGGPRYEILERAPLTWAVA
jgi:2'-5' RNA ligase